MQKKKKEKEKKICAMNGEDVVTASNVSKVVLKFHVGDFLLDNAPLYETSWSLHWLNGNINWEQSILYHTGDSQHTQNIQTKHWK